jgi:hypothetical protein
VAEHDRAVFDAWLDLCRRANVGEILVDVVAGTSAGGLNGTLLATAVARAAEGGGVRTVTGDSSSRHKCGGTRRGSGGLGTGRVRPRSWRSGSTPRSPTGHLRRG